MKVPKMSEATFKQAANAISGMEFTAIPIAYSRHSLDTSQRKFELVLTWGLLPAIRFWKC